MLPSLACVTTLGYVPELIKRGDNEKPTYGQVREWADDVADGYDSRATTNRSALYAGAILAAASVAALAGIAAYHPNSSALVIIPISTGFLGSVAAYYQNDAKSKLYRWGSNSVKGALTASDRRFESRVADLTDPDGAAAIEQIHFANKRRAEQIARNHIHRLEEYRSAISYFQIDLLQLSSRYPSHVADSDDAYERVSQTSTEYVISEADDDLLAQAVARVLDACNEETEGPRAYPCETGRQSLSSVIAEKMLGR